MNLSTGLSEPVHAINSSNYSLQGPNWTPLSVMYVPLIICALCSNGTLLVTFLIYQNLRTPFNLYLMNFLVTNLLSLVLNHAFDVVNNLYSGWWLGNGTCTVFLFGQFWLEAVLECNHMLIAVNRIWAVFWPHSYRSRHNNPVALLIISASWLYTAAVIWPGLIMDALYYREDPLTDGGCFVNLPAQPVWNTCIKFLAYNTAILVMWIVVPVVWWKRRRLASVVPIIFGPMKQAGSRSRETVEEMEVEAESARWRSHRLQGVPLPRKRSSKGFVVLICLTVSVTLTWFPTSMFYLYVALQTKLDFKVAAILFELGGVLFAVQNVLDPVFFVCSLPEVRAALRRMFHL